MEPSRLAPVAVRETAYGDAAPECYLAVDVGGTKLAAALVTTDGEVLIRDRIATPARDPWSALARLVARVQASVPAARLLACGVGCGGPMTPNGEAVSPLHIPAWRSYPLRAHLSSLTGLPTFIENDAKALALAEAWKGSAQGERNFMVVVIATGVGGGIVVDGRLLQGRLGNAGHIGHVVVEEDGRPCACGGRGCLEAYLSGPALENETGRPPRTTSPALVERNGRLFGRAVAGIAALLDIRLVLVGGSVALGFGRPFFESAQVELEDRSRLSFTEGVRIEPVGLGDRSPLVGAAAVAHRNL